MIAELTTEQKRTAVLWFLQGVSIANVALRCNCSRARIERYLRDAVHDLVKCLRDAERRAGRSDLPEMSACDERDAEPAAADRA